MIPEWINGFTNGLSVPGFQYLEKYLVEQRLQLLQRPLLIAMGEPFQLRLLSPDADKVIP